MELWTITVDPAVKKLLGEMVQDLDSGESTEEERIAYSYVLRRFISDLLDDKYTINM
ncbi:hypothetical protein JZO73_08140 [Enterococcus plantarum]|uniref:hypothetical protein n=1 Tax=Enterococcus plantarum TaxID=1077675 RepID=UPI001A90C32B|nr:hypothetical protein [Enterococcus plantarum]MBO0467506.1 hypothetical protein [Enterococcus plantarum]